MKPKNLTVKRIARIIYKHISTQGERFGVFGYNSTSIDVEGASKEIFTTYFKKKKNGYN